MVGSVKIPGQRLLQATCNSTQQGIYMYIHNPSGTPPVVRAYSGTSLIWTPSWKEEVSLLVRCPDFSGCSVHRQGV